MNDVFGVFFSKDVNLLDKGELALALVFCFSDLRYIHGHSDFKLDNYFLFNHTSIRCLTNEESPCCFGVSMAHLIGAATSR